MSPVLHIVARTNPLEPSPLARDLAATPWKHATTVRVLELVDPRPGATLVDLSLNERDIPELTALLHVAEEVHVHGVHPAVVMRALPAVRPAVLAGIAMIVHGPIPAIRASDVEIPTWPGAVSHDARAQASLEPPATLAALGIYLDLHAPDLLPRACGPLPLVLDEGGRLAVVCLGEGLSEPTRASLRIGLEALSRPELRIEVYEEAEHPCRDRAARRRSVQAVVVSANDVDTDARSYLEALAQALPVIVLGRVAHELPPGVVPTGERDEVERCIACIRAWGTAWSSGEATHVDAVGRRRWLAQRVA
jgi:hypothetical protein